MNNSKEYVCTFVTNNKVDLKRIINFFSKFQNTNQISRLSNEAVDVYFNEISKKKETKIRNFCLRNKIDICIQPSNFRKKKVFFSDMDATIIKNETLDDLVKISGTKLNIDETSKLAMEGKIPLKEILSIRVSHLKNKSTGLFKKIFRKIKFSHASDILIKTLNRNNFYTCLLTGGFKPISTYVAKKLGFKKYISNKFVIRNKKFTGDYIPITGKKNSKLFFLKKICKERNFDKTDIISIGDGANDIGMLQFSGLGIGYNAHNIVKKKITNQIQFTDLTTVLYYLGFKKKDFIY